jgi:hypothetical protein
LHHVSCTTDCCGQLLNITNGRIDDIQRLRRLLIGSAGLLGTGLGVLATFSTVDDIWVLLST